MGYWIAPLISNPLRTSQSNRSPLASNLTGEVIALEQAVKGEVARVNGSKAWSVASLTSGFPPVMSYVTASSLSIIWNGECTAAFTLGRGLSKAGVSAGFTYLFVLCMEKLAQNISSVGDTKVWKRLKPARWGAPILFRVQRLKVENCSSNLSGLMLRKAWTKKFHLLIAKKVMIDLDSRSIVG
ncbi:hypothetical protein Salat_0879200 [Sesamum alatum]|uniref:Uncharacterized protein n=1 Tax=Sesamum alatum TaxID=300844 RepID=A0AAE1YJ67_9LAMI|nr:hypothetical protein Salat_0879200 [Sesamum alatum]